MFPKHYLPFKGTLDRDKIVSMTCNNYLVTFLDIYISLEVN